MRIQTTSIIRDRGQLTIPETIRKAVGWVSPLSAVSISTVHPDEIVIRPHRSQKEVDWDKLWKQIRRVRAFKGKGRGNLSAFIAKDRESRR
jgi:bifunctional DNA-binding transcriptional regulator/antitoxin component of YhaV-PrlF toxin-antitoxin module